ncbi:MAG TPA: ribonuclease domain-containing protein, partial [Bacillales bacterium]|nr:ribonuclease domain-containing protein [Bacillales bacterium]
DIPKGIDKSKTIAWSTPNSLPKGEEKALLNTLSHLDKGIKPTGQIGKKWGAPFGNKEGHLPQGNYREYTVAPPPGSTNRGTRRVVQNTDTGALYYTWTHYG